MNGRVERWNGSLVVSIPDDIAVETDLREGNDVDVSVRNGNVVIRAGGKPELTPEELVEQITDENRTLKSGSRTRMR